MYKISLAIFQSKNRFIRLVVQIVIKKQSVSYYQDNVGLQHFVLCVCDRRWRFQQDCQTVNRVTISCRVWNTEGSLSLLHFASARFPVRLTESTEIASEIGGPVMATSAVGFSSTG